jgi:Protein of unknown function (DUF3365)
MTRNTSHQRHGPLLGVLTCAAGLILTVTLGAQQPLPTSSPIPTFPTWPASKAPAELQPVISRADLVVVAMHDSVLRELTDALSRGGPGSAMAFCHLDSTYVAQRVGRTEGIGAGRTSDRLRNPTNAPKPWAAALVKANAGKEARSVEGFAVDLGDRVGLLRPIAERAMCDGCHGPADKLSPAVRSALQDRYPVDRAVGFRDGEIRGWFWVEMPKRPQ